ncbi:ligase [Marinobacterium nitratireducens]|uniref:Ligase n=1 Tax=Marinobacterium nitratireducens TaxID=518897 RepID=A0A917ZH21_9GAMM|nr:AMP-binding protein [Marinobacterium nitratireducens]GGO81849.1 ligase [Marinobacterium nitratireducens]
MNLGRFISRSARYWSGAPAVADKRGSITYAELDQRSSRLANALLGLGLEPGDRVAMYSLNRTELVEIEVALYKAGLVKAPLNARLSLDEAIHVIEDADPRVLIVGPEHAEQVLDRQRDLPSIEHIVVIGKSGEDHYEGLLFKGASASPDFDLDPEAPAVLHYTSGSSGRLKAAVQTYGNRMALIRKSFMIPESRSKVTEKMAHVGPVTHASGMQIMPVLLNGGCHYLIDQFDIESLLATIEREKITRFFAVPTMIYRLLDAHQGGKYDLSSLNRITYGAAPMAPPRLREAIETFGPIFTQGYGAGETTSTITSLLASDHVRGLADKPELLASCGRAFGESEVMIADDDGNPVASGEPGEILVRGPDVMQGYWRAPDLTAEVLKDGWYHTGDVATVDEEGFFFIIDRKKDMIISGGFNVYPAEVESVLFNHPAISECCVVGVPDKEWGESITALVVPKPGASVSEAELAAFCTARLARFKKPRTFQFTEELPKNPNGKVARRLVREKFWQQQDRKVG